MSRTKRTPKKALVDATAAAKARALTAFRKLHTVSGACAAARVGRTTWYEWLEKDEAFRTIVAEASEQGLDELEAEAHKRAKGKHGSDTLLIFLLKSQRRAKYGDRQVITFVSPEVQVALQATLQLIGTRQNWDSAELIAAMEPLWK
jgi:hypothetical protein